MPLNSLEIVKLITDQSNIKNYAKTVINKTFWQSLSVCKDQNILLTVPKEYYFKKLCNTPET